MSVHRKIDVDKTRGIFELFIYLQLILFFSNRQSDMNTPDKSNLCIFIPGVPKNSPYLSLLALELQILFGIPMV